MKLGQIHHNPENPSRYTARELLYFASFVDGRMSDVLELIALGQTYKRIGQILGVSRERAVQIARQALDRSKIRQRECQSGAVLAPLVRIMVGHK